MTVTTHRLVAALEKDPGLLFSVCAQLQGHKILGPWKDSRSSRRIRSNPAGKAVLQVDKLAGKPLWVTRNPRGGDIGGIPSMELAMCVADNLAMRFGWDLVHPTPDSKRIARCLLNTGLILRMNSVISLGGMKIATLTKHPSRGYFLWKYMYGQRHANGDHPSKRIAKKQLLKALHDDGWTLLPESVTGLSKPFPQIGDLG